MRAKSLASVGAILVMAAAVSMPSPPAEANRRHVVLRAVDFTYGTYIIDEPGVYRLGEDISFNPNSPATLTQALDARPRT